ncbi:MAG: carbohydrate-binding domain-containing protein [Clostridia bacterium]|nr:carbohydrate-binding domain-containing protein [Clostridia bacterium]
MKHKRILSLLVAVVMCAGFMPGYTLAATAETVGDLTIATANSSGYSYDSGSRLLTISGGGDYEISGSSSSDTIKVTAGDDVTITLDDVNIQSAGAPPLEIDAAGNVTIELKNENTLDASEGHSGYAGLQKTSTGNTLTITGSGELTATGGFGGGAGIGGAYHGDGSNIVIESGTIEATSSDGGAGIGAGAGYSYHNGASVTINGGTVTATGGSGAGGDACCACGFSVTGTINGGAVTSTSSGGGAGIGGGVGDYGSVTVNINGGTVSATGDGGAGIGSGNGGSGSVTVNITGGTVNATDDGNGASLGSGKDNERNNNVNISGGYITLSKSSSDADYIGSGADSPDATDTVNITGGYFGDGSYSADTVYGCTVAEGYVVCANTNAGTSGAYPCYVSVSYEAAAKNSDGVYEIANTGQLFWFAALVNGDTTQEGINYSVPGADGILTADIDLGGAEWTPIGDYAASSIMYAGTFDGDGHIISGLYINSSSSYRGLFGYVKTTGTVKNVTVYGSVTGNNYVGGIVGNNYGIVTNCTADVSVSGTYAGGIVGLNRGEVTYCFNSGAVGGSMYIGGVVGSTGSGAVVANCGNSGAVSGSGMNMNIGGVAGENVGTVADCFNSGEVSGSTYVGGVIGFNMASASNCYSSGTVGGSWNVGGVVGYNYANGNSYNGSVTNCCYLENTADAAIGVDSGTTTDTFSKTSEEFASGEVAYLLNSGTTDGTQAWYQTLGTDDCPVLDSAHGAVYYTTICDGSSTFYSNSSVIHAGSYDENGFCTVCGGYQPATLNSDGIYEIANAGQLFWFAALIEGDTSHEGIFAANTDVSAVLTKSIDLSVTTIEWTPIGTKSAPYTGTFDGDGFEISELNITTAAEYIGLFGYVSTGTIKNLTVSGEIDVSGATIFAGGIVGTIRNGVLSNLTSNVDVTGKTADKGTFGGVAATVEGTDGTEGSTMELCVNNGKVTASGKLDCTGGLVGYMNSATIINSVNYGEVDTTGATAHQNAGVNTGGIVGYINNKTAYITNCVNIGKVSNAVSVTTGSNKMYCYTGAVVGRIRDDIGAITNVYYLNTGTNAAIGENEYGKEVDITAQTAEEFAKGAAAWLLQNANTDYVWGQDLGNDAFPLLTSDANKKVVKVSFYNFSGTTVLMESYTNMGGTVSSYPTDYTLYADSALTDVIGDIDTRAFYADTDIYAAEVRDLTITGTGIVEGTDYTYENNLLTVLTGGEYKISGTSTSDTIKVAASDDVTITLAGVDITNSSKPPMEIDCDSTVTVKLSGENTLESTGSDYAGLQLTNGNLTITSADDDGKTTGSLDAAGGIYAAGIGSGDSSDMSGNITINGGTVSGSSTYGAGIGSGDSANMNGSITINGSTASGTSSYGAGIGSGFWADMSGSITINGGTVSGTSLKSGAGIGSGRSEYDWDSNSGLNKLSGSITITGGTVFGTSAYSAGIGCGYYSNMTGSISISGGYVTAESDSGDNITATNTSIIGGYFADSSFTAGVGSEGAVYDCGIADGYVAYANIEDTNNVYYARVLSTGWTANVTYTAPFGASGTVPTDDKDYGYGAKVTVDDTLPLTKGSYGQTGWSLSDADTTSVTSFAISSDTILYPVFARQFTDTGVSTDISLTYGEAIAEIDLNDYLQFVDTSIDTNGQFTFALADGSELPEGLELKNDVISGTPTAATTAAQSVSFTVTDNNPGYTLFAALEGNPATVSATLTLTFNVAKATPTYSVPSGITAVYGDTLATVTLPTDWTWDDENLSVGNIGTNEFAATFTPSDTANYETITENVSITVAPLPIEVE